MTLPLKPPIKPQLAKSAKTLPEGDDLRYEPKWDGFRTLVYRDGGDVYLQSRGGKPMNRYFPDIEELVRAMPADGVVLDGEIVIEIDGIQEFDLLSQRIHPAASRVEKLAAETPAFYVAFDLLAQDGDELLELSYDERRARLEKLDLEPGEANAGRGDAERRRQVADRQQRGRDREGRLGAPTCPASARG